MKRDKIKIAVSLCVLAVVLTWAYLYPSPEGRCVSEEIWEDGGFALFAVPPTKHLYCTHWVYR